MSTIPTSLTENQFDEHVRPFISTAKRGYESKIPLYKIFNYILYRLHTGCQWYQLPICKEKDDPEKKEISHDAVYYHYRKWSKDGSLESVWQGSIMTISEQLNLSELNLDGSHAIAKKGGESVAYQGRKKAKTTNILPITDGEGFIDPKDRAADVARDDDLGRIHPQLPHGLDHGVVGVPVGAAGTEGQQALDLHPFRLLVDIQSLAGFDLLADNFGKGLTDQIG